MAAVGNIFNLPIAQGESYFALYSWNCYVQLRILPMAMWETWIHLLFTIKEKMLFIVYSQIIWSFH